MAKHIHLGPPSQEGLGRAWIVTILLIYYPFDHSLPRGGAWRGYTPPEKIPYVVKLHPPPLQNCTLCIAPYGFGSLRVCAFYTKFYGQVLKLSTLINYSTMDYFWHLPFHHIEKGMELMQPLKPHKTLSYYFSIFSCLATRSNSTST